MLGMWFSTTSLSCDMEDDMGNELTVYSALKRKLLNNKLVAAVVLVVVVVVGLGAFTGAVSTIIAFFGHSSQLNSSDEPTDEAISFFISYARAENVIEGDATVYLAGADDVSLHVEHRIPFTTVTAMVPKPGTYTYRVEIDEVRSPMVGADRRNRFQISGEGKIDVTLGVAFKLIPRTLKLDGGGGEKWITRLETISSDEEKRKLQDEALRILEEESK